MTDLATSTVALSWAGTVTSLIQNLSGVPLLRQVIKERDSSKYTKAPLWMMTGTTLLIGLYSVFVVYPITQRVDGLIICNFVAVAFWWISLGVFCCYAPTRKEALIIFGTYLALVLSCI